MLRHLIALTLLFFFAFSSSQVSASNPAFRSFDTTMQNYMSKHGIPGGSVAVVKDGRLVYMSGYGWADVEKKQPVQPTSLFRIASISKPVTAVAVFTLLQNSGGRFSLDTPAFSLLPFSPACGDADPRLKTITVRQLLQHTAGWDKDETGIDPMFQSTEIAGALHVTPPARQDSIIRYVMGQPLQFDPGSKYSYSNFGYCVLGRVIEKISGQSYEQYVKEHVLAPMGITRMKLGRSLLKDQADGEVRYYTDSEDQYSTVFPGYPTALQPYGSFCIEAMDSHGGWLASAVDLARFAAALDDSKSSKLLMPDSRKAMYARPPAPAWVEDGKPSDYYYGCGWLVRPVGSRANYWHLGCLPGTYTILVRRSDGLTWVALFNGCSLANLDGYAEIDLALHQAAAQVTEWPSGDLFR